MKSKIYFFIKVFFFYLFRLLPLRNKIIATTMRGRKYGDNPQFILEKLHEIDNSLDLVWLKNIDYSYDLPDWIRFVPYYGANIKLIYELATAKVWINTHRYESWFRKRKGQLVIETWHGGLGLKKIEMDAEVPLNDFSRNEINNTIKISDVFISQSEHLSSIYRRAFGYQGVIYKCGYPKNDFLLTGDRDYISNKIKSDYNINDKKILLYVPTFRDVFEKSHTIDYSVYDIDWDRLYNKLLDKFGGDWVFFIKFHPIMLKFVDETYFNNISNGINVTSYPDTQDLIMASDIVISDYSSCIFDAALLDIPCFTFATDFDDYKSDRGVYYEMEELPFPNAKNNDELINNIGIFNYDEYLNRWEAFKVRTGLYESGHAAEDIAKKIINFINLGNVQWN